MTLKIVERGQIEQAAGGIPPFYLPAPHSRYTDRAARFDTLAAGHPLADYLRLCAAISRAQAGWVKAQPLTLPERDHYWEACALHGLPPLGTDAWPRDLAWQDGLRFIVRELQAGQPADAIATVLARLAAADAAALEQQASVLLSGDWSSLDRATAPFLAAALQAYFSQLASQLQPGWLGARHDHAGHCPACGSAPTASTLRPGAEGLRYVHCSLCETEWHQVRVSCTGCGSTKGIAYWTLDDREVKDAVVQAESCDECHGYLKLLHPEKALDADPLADDLATLTLDLLLDEKGYQRGGPNLLFYPG